MLPEPSDEEWGGGSSKCRKNPSLLPACVTFSPSAAVCMGAGDSMQNEGPMCQVEDKS